MKKKKVICIGEALIDRIRNKSNQGFTDFLGGAPANVACALRKFKIDSIFMGSLGNDDYGKKLKIRNIEEKKSFIKNILNNQISNNDIIDRLIEALRENSFWSRYGL